MADQQSYRMYSAEDIRRYLDGSMTAREMHELERAALHDPFLADAIDGFSGADAAITQQHLNELAAAIQGQPQEQTRVIPMVPRKTRWYSVAAVVLLMAGAGAITWKLVQQPTAQQETGIAAVTEAVLQKDTQMNSITPDTVVLADEQQAKVKDHTTVQQKAVQPPAARYRETLSNPDRPGDAQTQPAAGDIASAKDDDAISSESAASLAVADNRAAAAPADKKATAPPPAAGAAKYRISGRIVDAQQQPVPNAIVDAGNRNAVVTDREGKFELLTTDSAVDVTVSSLGYAEARQQVASNLGNKVVLEADVQTLSEVVTSSYGKSKKANKADANVTGDAYPEGGWASFQEYVYKKLNKENDSTNNRAYAPGNVELEFDIEEDGTPATFKVLKSLNPSADTTAIDIIREGPRWISDKRRRQKGKVTIRF